MHPRSRLARREPIEGEIVELEEPSYFETMRPMFATFAHAPSAVEMRRFILAVMAEIVTNEAPRGAIARTLRRDDLVGSKSTYKKWRKFYPSFTSALNFGIALVSGDVEAAREAREREAFAMIQETTELIQLASREAAETLIRGMSATRLVYLGNDEDTGERIVEQEQDHKTQISAARDLLDRIAQTSRKTSAQAIAIAGATAEAKSEASAVNVEAWKQQQKEQLEKVAETIDLLG